MKKVFRYMLTPLLVGVAVNLASCDDDTAFVGSDIMPGGDDVSTSFADYSVYSRSVKIDSVLANTNDCYLGCIVDPETRALTECGFLAQFHIMENYSFPDKKRMILDENGLVMADSCDIRISFSSYYGDSLQTMKLNVHELDTNKVMSEDQKYYTNFSPADFYSEKGLKTSLVYAIKDLTRPSVETDGGKYLRNVIVRLPAAYGSFIMNKYYENPKFFKNSYQFIHHVCPGFYFETIGSVGSMINAQVSTLDLYFRYHTKTKAGNDTIVDGMQRMAATEEVIQSTRVENQMPDGMLDERNAYTYLKTPTGIFTEVTLPVSDIVAGEHRNDTINGAKISFRKHNDVTDEKFKLVPPEDLLLVRKGIVSSFFEANRLPDVKDSYLATYNPITRSYIYGNIAPMLTVMKLERDKGAGIVLTDTESQRQEKYAAWEKKNPDWNKVMLIPVKAEYSVTTDIYGYSQKKLLQIRNAMGIHSAKIEGGQSDNLKMTVIYSRFNN